jgi:hypothetical protein
LFKALIRQISQITFSLETFIYREKSERKKKSSVPTLLIKEKMLENR